MTTLHHVKKARKAIRGTGIKKGDSYYWWRFAFSSKQVSKERPRRSQYATRSEHLGAIYDIEDDLAALTVEDISESFSLDEYIQQLEEVRDTCEERLSNMPDQLQEAPAGQTLQEYIDACENWINELEGIDLSINEEEIREAAAEEYNQALNDYDMLAKEEEAEEPEEDEEEIFQRLLDERKQEILDDIQNTSSGV